MRRPLERVTRFGKGRKPRFVGFQTTVGCRNKICQADCLQILAAIPENCVHLVFADPPYFLANDGIPPAAGHAGSRRAG